MRFVCDHDVDAAVAKALRRLGHQAWTAADAGLSAATDDELTAYADDQGAALLTHDVEFSRRRRRNVVGKHIWLRCVEFEAVELVTDHLDTIVLQLEHHDDVWMRVSADGIELAFDWR